MPVGSIREYIARELDLQTVARLDRPRGRRCRGKDGGTGWNHRYRHDDRLMSLVHAPALLTPPRPSAQI